MPSYVKKEHIWLLFHVVPHVWLFFANMVPDVLEKATTKRYDTSNDRTPFRVDGMLKRNICFNEQPKKCCMQNSCWEGRSNRNESSEAIHNRLQIQYVQEMHCAPHLYACPNDV